MELYILSSSFSLSRSSAAAMAGTPKSTLDPTDSTIPLTSPAKPDSAGRSNHWGDENTNYRHPTQRFGVSLRRQHSSSLPGSCCRVVTKISSCRVNTTSRRGNQTELGISFGSIFLLFSNKSSRGPLS